MATTSIPNPPILLTLPRELRDTIYDLVVDRRPHELKLGALFWTDIFRAPALLHVSRQCCIEFGSVYLKALAAAKTKGCPSTIVDGYVPLRADVVESYDSMLMQSAGELVEKVKRNIQLEA